MFSNEPVLQVSDSEKDLMSRFVGLVRTKHEQETLLREIDLVLESLYLTKERSFENILEKSVRVETAKLVREAKDKEKNFQGFLKALRQVLSELSQIDLTLAVEPSDELINQLYHWIRINLNMSLVINFTKNSEILGGAQISYKGNYFEYSIRKVLDQVLDKKTI